MSGCAKSGHVIDTSNEEWINGLEMSEHVSIRLVLTPSSESRF